jgi:hypothetical protein
MRGRERGIVPLMGEQSDQRKEGSAYVDLDKLSKFHWPAAPIKQKGDNGGREPWKQKRGASSGGAIGWANPRPQQR